MITAILVTVLPTIFFLIIFKKLGIIIQSHYFRITLAWFSGLFFFTIAVFLCSLVLSTFTSQVLIKATYSVLLFMQCIMFLFVKDLGTLLIALKNLPKAIFKSKKEFIFVLFCLLFSVLFYTPHLQVINNGIYTSPVYWDFHWHASLIQNFVHGDNFPPENEAFGGVTHTYHYLWAVAAAIYNVSGLDLVWGINTISILSFFFILIGTYGLVQELFKEKKIGVYVVMLILTSSSFHWIYFIHQHNQGLIELISAILFNKDHPFSASFIPGFPFGYQGVFFNLFYFLEERQLLLGILFIIISIWFLYKRKVFSHIFLFLLGFIMGAFFLWHLYSTIMILCSIIFLLIFDKERKKTFYIFLGFIVTFSAHALYFKNIIDTQWFYSTIFEYPKLNFTFASNLTNSINLEKFLTFYIFSYGIKVLFLFIGFRMLWKKNRSAFIILISIILPTFLLTNTVQLSPGSIAENHKWLIPLNVIINIVAGYGLYYYCFTSIRNNKIIIGVICLFLLTFSGIIELMPFLNSKPTRLYTMYPSTITKAIQYNSMPKSIFIGNDKASIGIAGRKLFLGDPLGGDMRLKTNLRKQIIYDIYLSTTKDEFCKITQKNNIDYVEFDMQYTPLFIKQLDTKYYFSTKNDYDRNVQFINIEKLCTK